MRYQPLAAVALTAGPVFASPGTVKTTQDAHEHGLLKRDEQTWDTNGNIKLTFSQDTVKIGDVKLDDMFAKLYDVCHESGQCETEEQTFDGWWQASGPNGDMGPITVTMNPSGAYPTWIRNGLVDALRAAVLTGARCGDSTNTQLCQGGIDNKGCSPVKTVAYQCEVPAFWGINFQDASAASAAPPNIGVDVHMDLVDSGVCADMMTGLGAVAGAVNGVAGGIFSLLTFACT